jgi:hypothetical protein
MEEKRFDILRNKAERFEVQPSEQLFDSILERMAGQKPKRRFGWIWGSAGLSVAAGLAAWLLFFPNSNRPTQELALQAPQQQVNEPNPRPALEQFRQQESGDSLGFVPNATNGSQAAGLVNFENSQNQSTTESGTSAAAKPITTDPGNSSLGLAQEPKSKTQEGTWTQKASENPDYNTHRTKNEAGQAAFDLESTNSNDAGTQKSAPGRTSATHAQANRVPTAGLKSKNKRSASGEAPNKKRKGDAHGQAPDVDRKFEEPVVTIPQSEVLRVEPEVRFPKPMLEPYSLNPVFRQPKFSLRAWTEFSAFSVNQRLVKSEGFEGKESSLLNAEQHLNQREAFNQPDFAFSAGAGLALSYKWAFFKTGMQYTQLNFQEQAFSFKHYGQTVYTNVTDTLNFTNAQGVDTTVLVNHQQAHLVDAVDTIRHNNRSRVEYLQIPLVMGARYERGTWFAEIEAGVNLSIRSSGNALGYMQPDASNMAPFSPLQNDRWNDFGIDLITGFNLGWKFAKRWEAAAGFRMQYGLQSIYDQSHVLDQRYHMMGGTLSLRYRIR